MFENKTQQFSRFHLNNNNSKFNELKESEPFAKKVEISTQTRK